MNNKEPTTSDRERRFRDSYLKSLPLHFALCTLLFVLLTSPFAHGAVWYVDVDNTVGPCDGMSRGTAFQTIQQGIDAAYHAGGEVWVAVRVDRRTRRLLERTVEDLL